MKNSLLHFPYDEISGGYNYLIGVYNNDLGEIELSSYIIFISFSDWHDFFSNDYEEEERMLHKALIDSLNQL